MAWTLAEGLVDSIVTYFTASFGAVLDIIDAEMADGIILDDPVVIETAEQNFKSIQNYPVMMVLVDNATIGKWTGAEVEGGYQLMIGMIVIDADPTVLRKRLYRYGRAIFETIANVHGTGDIGAHLGVGEINIGFSPLFTSSRSQYIADVSAVIPVVMKETR